MQACNFLQTRSKMLNTCDLTKNIHMLYFSHIHKQKGVRYLVFVIFSALIWFLNYLQKTHQVHFFLLLVLQNQTSTAMKKTFTLLVLSIAIATTAFAQCEPDPAYTTPGIYPDTATGFTPAYATFLYELVITAIIPADTIVPPFPRLPIDSIGVVEVQGLPEGFEALPNTPSGFWHGGTAGCMLITGTASHSQVGNYPLVFKLVGYMGGINLAFPFDLDAYSLEVRDSAALILPDLSAQYQNNIKVSPNPVSNSFELSFYSKTSGTASCQILHVNQQQVMNVPLQLSPGQNRHFIDAGNLKPGVYICIIRKENGEKLPPVRFIRK